jgi:hypothetical protein
VPEEFNPSEFFAMLRKSASVKAGAIMFGQAQIAYYDVLKENMTEEQAFSLLAHTTEQVVRGVFNAVGPVCEVLLKAAAMAEMIGKWEGDKPGDKKVPE